MADIQKAALFGKLDSLAYKAIEAATTFCKLRGNPYVELVHWINQIMQLQDSDIQHIVRAFNLNPSRLATDLQTSLDKLPRGSTSIQGFSPQLEETIKDAWLYSTLMFNELKVRTGHIMVALLQNRALKAQLVDISREFEKIKLEQLTDDFAKITSASIEGTLAAREGGVATGAGAAPGEASGAMAPAQMGKMEGLKKFSTDITEKARKGELDPIVGRDHEIRQIVDVLMRRRQNNPILTGEAGVGKTAVVEGFSLRVVSGDVPPALKDVSVRSLDIGLMQAGASMKGEFEQRLRQVIEEVQSSPKPIILFIDEAHTLIGAGGAAGTGDAANLLKPALARGTLRTIAATTWDEYKKHIEKDPALVRRFQVVKIDEPSEEKGIQMMRAVATSFEKHHKVQILDEALEAAVRLSARYIPAAQLPDKAVKLIDTASARVGISQHAVPAEVDDARRRIQVYETELGILGRETDVGMDHKSRVNEITTSLEEERKRLKALEESWAKEKDLVAKVLEIRGKLRGAGVAVDAPKPQAADAKAPPPDAKAAPAAPAAPAPLSEAERAKLLADLQAVQAELAALQGERPLIVPSVDAQSISSVVADWTGIPVGRMARNEIEQVLKLADLMERRVIGQRHALELIAKRIRTSRAKLDNPQRPIGVFMLVGPSGTGKTETALTLAEALYGGEQNLIKINMAEFQEAHTVSTLKGSPPGYVGYGEGGVLTEAVRRRPYSVVLLDEVEKAHPDVHEIFFEAFDKGHMEDAEGRDIDFKNTIILLTSNAAQDVIINMTKDPDLMPSAEGLEKAMREPLKKVFPDALLNRLVVVPFYPISREMMRAIIKLNLSRVEKRVAMNHRLPFTYDPAVLDFIADRCTELERGARMVEALITNNMLPAIGLEVLTRLMDNRPLSGIHVGVKDNDFAYTYA
ncbi:MAG: type VI secretion system ATPase TssH [Tepidisphaerales bacterium]